MPIIVIVFVKLYFVVQYNVQYSVFILMMHELVTFIIVLNIK